MFWQRLKCYLNGHAPVYSVERQRPSAGGRYYLQVRVVRCMKCNKVLEDGNATR